MGVWRSQRPSLVGAGVNAGDLREGAFKRNTPPPRRNKPRPACLQPEHDFQPRVKTRTNKENRAKVPVAPHPDSGQALELNQPKRIWVRGVTAEAWTPRWPAKVRKSRLACHPSPFWCLGNPQKSNASALPLLGWVRVKEEPEKP